MSKTGFVIQCASEPTNDISSRVRNFAEDLFYVFRDEQLASVDNMDTATNEVLVEVSKSQNLGRVGSEIKRLLNKHNFPEAVIFRR